MDDEDVMDPQAASVMLAKLSGQYGALGTQEAAAMQQVARSRAERLREAEEKIRAARFGMPSSSEQLFALSSALLSPMQQRGLAGTLSNVVPVLGGISKARRGAEDEREQALMKLRAGYADDTETSDLARIKAERAGMLDLMKVYGPLAKPRKANNAFNPQTGRLTDTDTGEIVETPNERLQRVPPQAVATLKTYLANPAATPVSKQAAMRNFETQFGVPARLALENK